VFLDLAFIVNSCDLSAALSDEYIIWYDEMTE